ncbi:MAG: energy transducer TonB [Gammaproteobacteria bacterium]|nr:energy transducer TonB [Gammaproteobacteria bacterium]
MNWVLPLDEPTLHPNGRMQRALVIAVLLHLFFVFAIGFQRHVPPRHSLPTLDLVLVKEERPSVAPEPAEALAEHTSVAEPELPEPAEPSPDPVDVPPPEPVVAPPKPAKPPQPPKPAKAEPVLTRKPEQLPSVAHLVSRSIAMDALSKSVDATVSEYQALPRQRHISASTREFKYAQYMLAWVAKVERVGNLNYPEAARRDNLRGRLILDVALRPDGSIQAIEFVKSSGHDALDQAAVRIVEMAAPYAAFPPDIRDETDVLHITRTWEFSQGNRLSGQ